MSIFKIKIKWQYAVFFCLFSFNASANMAEEICTYLKSQFPELQKKLPMQLDEERSFINISANFSEQICTLTYDYMINSNQFAQSMARNNNLTVQENIEWMKTEEGGLVLNDVFTEDAQNSAKALGSITQHKGIRAVYIFVFDDPDIVPIITIGADTTK